MYFSNPYDQYKKSSVESISPGEVIIKLFEGACKFLEHAKKAMENGEKVEANTNITKVQDILAELMNSLDFEYSISNQIYIMYNYMYMELVKITVSQDIESLIKIKEMMYEYLETWKETNQLDRIEKHSYSSNGGSYV